MSAQPHAGLRIASLNCRRSPEVVLSLLNGPDAAQWDVFCLQELPAHIADHASFRSPHWSLLLPSPAGSRAPGAAIRSAIYVHNKFRSDSYTQISLPSLDVCGVIFSLPQISFSLLSVYNPPNSDSSLVFLRTALRDPALLSVPCMLAGDFNLHHPLWSGPHVPQRTRRSDAAPLLQVLAEHSLFLALPEGAPTFQSGAHGTWSTLDLVFAARPLTELVTRCEPGFGHGSDHRSVEIELNLDLPVVEPPARRNWRDADWDRYQAAVTELWVEQRVHSRALDLRTTTDIDSLVSDLTDILIRSAEGAVPLAKPCPHSKRWWSPVLTALKRAARRLSNRAARRRASLEDVAAARVAVKEYHTAIRRQKRRHWREYVESATEHTIWQASKYVTQAPENTLSARLPALTRPDGSVARSRSEKCDTLMAQFFPPPPEASLDDITDASYSDQLHLDPFTEEEVAAAITNLSPYKAPGPSGVPNVALKECSLSLVPVFTNIINRCIELGHHPAQWKFFTTITLRKPGKPSYLVPKAYRPIALEDTSSKVAESVVARRLAALAEEHGLLPANHFGGRAHRTTTDAVLHLVQRIKDAWRTKRVTSVLYLDISSAFPSVNHRRLLHNLRKRRVPEPMVRWIAAFLRERRTQLTFDDFTSDPLLADCGIPQGSPLSPILYLFYSADLLELVDPKDRARLSLGFIDDTAMAVSSPNIATNVRILSELVPKLLDWSRRHACKFDIAKFQLVHHTKYEPHYSPLPLQVAAHTIQPSESAKYLGIIVDRRLAWSEHVEAAIAKGTAAMLAVGRLSRPTFGLPHRYARQLFQAVVCPKLEYGLPVWYTPVCRTPGARRASGSVGIARRIGRVQRIAGLMITGAFKTTATVFLDFHSDLLPTELRLNRSIHRAAARLATLPVSHPLYPAIRRCSSSYPRFHRSPLHELFHSFPDLRLLRPVCDSPSPPSDRSLEVVVGTSKQQASAQMAAALASRDTVVFVHGCTSGNNMGAAAVAARRDGGRVSVRASLGLAGNRQVHDGALAALTLGLGAIMGCPRVTRACLLVPDRAAATALSTQPDHPLTRLFLTRLHSITRRARSSLRVRVIWAPDGHGGALEHARCQARDDAALAAEGYESPVSTILPAATLAALHSLGVQRAVLLRRYEEFVQAQWKTQWEASPQGRRYQRAIDPAPPGGNAAKAYRGLSRRQCSILTQLRSGHVGLNCFLARIGAVDSPLCAVCRVPESVSHYLLTCRRYLAPRHTLRSAVSGPLSLRSTLGNPKARTAVLDFVAATGRFPAYSAQLP